MTIFIRLLSDINKETAMWDASSAIRANGNDPRIFVADPTSFADLPGVPFAYWLSQNVMRSFSAYDAFESNGRFAQHGGSSKDDFRFLRLSWELTEDSLVEWLPFAKKGAYSPFYSDVYLKINWRDNARELEAALLHKYPYLGKNANWVLHRECNYKSPGLTWSRRTKSRLSMRILPKGCIFSDKGPAAFAPHDDAVGLLALLGLCVSDAFHYLVEVQLAAADARPGGAAHSFEVGVIQTTPVPTLAPNVQDRIATLARGAWSLMRIKDTTIETSHGFILPLILCPNHNHRCAACSHPG